jgi:predicted flap endonuclease-1-like 5' DNA nuclease/uncharacterized protein YicC (UPF0701 family)
MVSFTNEMIRLKDEIALLRESRSAFLRDVRENVIEERNETAAMIERFKTNRVIKAGEEKEGRRTFMANMKTEVADMLDSFREERSEIASETRAALDACISQISKFVSDLKNDVQDMTETLHKERIAKSREMGENLESFASGLKADVEKLLNEFERDRAALSAETKSMLLGCVSNTRTFVSDLKKNINAAQKALVELRKHKTEADRRARDEFVADLAHRVSALRQDIHKVRTTLAEDLSGARDVWCGVHTGQNAAEQAEMPVEENFSAYEAADELQASTPHALVEEMDGEGGAEEKPEGNAVADSLTSIPGVGAGRERMLNESGIYTFAQVAESTPEDLRRALGEMGRLASVESWIEAAKRLSLGEKSRRKINERKGIEACRWRFKENRLR